MNPFTFFILAMTFSCCYMLLPLSVKNGRIVNNHGYEIILHGVNVVFKVGNYTPTTGKWDKGTSFNDEDIKLLSHLGFNVVRLGVMWPGVLPSNDNKPDNVYLNTMESIINKLNFIIFTHCFKKFFSSWSHKNLSITRKLT